MYLEGAQELDLNGLSFLNIGLILETQKHD